MRLLLFLFCAVATIVRATPAAAQVDYDPHSFAWNGLSELVGLASEHGIDVRPVRELDWSTVRPNDALLVVYPTQRLGVADLSAFLDAGGRVAWLDDFGASTEFLDWFQFRREPRVRGIPRAPELPELLVARPRSTHVLAQDVDVLITNIPVALSHPRLSPVFDLPPEGHGLVLVGQIGRGKLIVGGDPSVLLNTMMRFPGNRQFASNLLDVLVSGERARVYMVWGNARARGFFRGLGRPPAREAVATLNDWLSGVSRALGAPAMLRPLATLLALAAGIIMAVILVGRRPSERYGPRGPIGTAVALAERVALYSAEKVNLLVPTLRARRHLEQRLLRTLGLRAPLDVQRLVEHPRFPAPQRAELLQLVSELDALARAAEEAAPPRVSSSRFLSLWRRIGAILRAVEAREA